MDLSRVTIEDVRIEKTSGLLNLNKSIPAIKQDLAKLPDPPEISPEEIDIFFITSTTRGKGKCLQKCEHCLLTALPPYEVDEILAERVSSDIRKLGYNLTVASEDSFSGDSFDFSKGQGGIYKVSGGECAWTSGTRIATSENWEELLDRAYEVGFRAIVMNAQGVVDTIPFKGIPSSCTIKEAIKRIQSWSNAGDLGKKFAIGLTFTMGNYNYRNKNDLLRKISFCLENGIDIVRLNCFTDFNRMSTLRKYQLTRLEVKRFFNDIAEIIQEIPDSSNMDIRISSDFGEDGLELIKQQGPLGICGAGRKMFRIAEIDGRLMVGACVERVAPIVGEVVWRENQWAIKWYYKKLKEIFYLQPYLYGCFGGIGFKRKEFNHPVAEKIMFST